MAHKPLARPRSGARPPTAAPQPPLRVLLIDDGAHRVEFIADELRRQGHEVVGLIDSARLIHDSVVNLKPDVVIVDAESPTRDTLEHLATTSSAHPRPVVVFAEDDGEAPMQQAMRMGVSAYVIAGLLPERLTPVLKVAMARFEQDQALRAQLGEAELKLSERRVIERAKGLLMSEVGLSEEQAHAHLRRVAMDRSERLAQAAERVVAARRLLRPTP